MQDVMSRLATLHRPRLLVRSARTEAANYNRTRDLTRILGGGTLPRPGAMIMQLLDLEQEINQQRLSQDAGYLIARHIDILIALMGEANYLPASKVPLAKRFLGADKGAAATLTTAPQTSP